MTEYINRKTEQKEVEKTPGRSLIEWLYRDHAFARFFSGLVCKYPFFSRIFGRLQKKSSSKKNIQPFIAKYKIDASEFLDPPSSFASFNDFFIRKLNPNSRPIDPSKDVAILPADGRYLVFQHIDQEGEFLIKGNSFSLSTLLQSKPDAKAYEKGAMVIARLAPVDYHRFHFPCDCTPGEARLINGPLYSVHPLALKRNIDILAENKRVITPLETDRYGTILYIEVGATNVGSIIQTYDPNQPVAKGDEKGYFSFGGSCLILLFPPDSIQLDDDLIQNTHNHLETLAHFGESMGEIQSS